MCEYCEDGILNSSIIGIEDNENSIGIYNTVYIEGNLLYSGISAFGDDVAGSVAINFCPMCGRELKEQEK